MNAVAPNPVTNAEFTRTLGRVLRRPTILPVPAFVLRVALGELADALLLSSQRALPKKMEQAGYSFVHPALEEGLQAVLSLAR
jgi:NAD dependent epimerase/dehydratase family enzyme